MFMIVPQSPAKSSKYGYHLQIWLSSPNMVITYLSFECQPLLVPGYNKLLRFMLHKTYFLSEDAMTSVLHNISIWESLLTRVKR